ncbi:MAG: lipolytic protein family, partial [Prosthecobacter sp.]|nr:lipolytic protein family [Prosthecobacter sp.]
SSMLRWVWADARIAGDNVIVSAPSVPQPQGLRYAYEDLPTQGATLCDGKGNPAAPFRTDDHLSVTGKSLDPTAPVQWFNPRVDLGIEDPRLPRILIIGDSISAGYLPLLRDRMRGLANVIGESSMKKDTWASMDPIFYRSDWAAKDDDLKNFLAARGPFHIVHFNNGIHNFFTAKPGDEKPYAEQLRKVVATIREAGAVCLFANSTGTVADNTIAIAPHYLTNCLVFNAAAEEVMKELHVPLTDIHGLTQPRIKELISGDLIHLNSEATLLMADLIAQRLKEALATLPPVP